MIFFILFCIWMWFVRAFAVFFFFFMSVLWYVCVCVCMCVCEELGSGLLHISLFIFFGCFSYFQARYFCPCLVLRPLLWLDIWLGNCTVYLPFLDHILYMLWVPLSVVSGEDVVASRLKVSQPALDIICNDVFPVWALPHCTNRIWIIRGWA